MKKLSLLVVLSWLLLWGVPAMAAGNNGLVEKFSDDYVLQVMRNEGYSPEKLKDGLIRLKVDGVTMALFNKTDGDMQLYYSLSGARMSLEDINEWNRTHRLSRAYLDTDKDPVLESDLLSNGGLTEKHVTEFMNVFKMSVSAFREFIGQRAKQ